MYSDESSGQHSRDTRGHPHRYLQPIGGPDNCASVDLVTWHAPAFGRQPAYFAGSRPTERDP